MKKNKNDYVIKDGKFIGKFEELYQNFDDPWQVGQADQIQYDMVLKMMHKYCPKPRRILDIGCGKGVFTNRIKEDYVLKGHYYHLRQSVGEKVDFIDAVDVSKTAIKKANKLWCAGTPLGWDEFGGVSYKVLDVVKDRAKIKKEYNIILFSQIMWYILFDFVGLVKRFHRYNLFPRGIIIINQSFCQKGEQKYGTDYINSPKVVIDKIGLGLPARVIETDRFHNHNAVIVYQKA